MGEYKESLLYNYWVREKYSMVDLYFLFFWLIWPFMLLKICLNETIREGKIRKKILNFLKKALWMREKHLQESQGSSVTCDKALRKHDLDDCSPTRPLNSFWDISLRSKTVNPRVNPFIEVWRSEKNVTAIYPVVVWYFSQDQKGGQIDGQTDIQSRDNYHK